MRIRFIILSAIAMAIMTFAITPANADSGRVWSVCGWIDKYTGKPAYSGEFRTHLQYRECRRWARNRGLLMGHRHTQHNHPHYQTIPTQPQSHTHAPSQPPVVYAPIQHQLTNRELVILERRAAIEEQQAQLKMALGVATVFSNIIARHDQQRSSGRRHVKRLKTRRAGFYRQLRYRGQRHR